ncbi:MAG: ECF-type sigma factor [Acidobacteriota bacterium]
MTSEPAPPGEVTQLLRAAAAGDPPAVDRLFELLYSELRRIAGHQRRAVSGGLTLNTTALVHEAYLKLSQHQGWSTRDRSHFFALCARAMRQILIDGARRRGAGRRGGSVGPLLELDEIDLGVPEPERGVEDILALDQALAKLAGVDADLARLVEFRYFAGLTIEEIAELTEVSPSTLKRGWRTARAFLHSELMAPPQAVARPAP